mmetsp:Transcript_26199/g.57230  ORF Transcript_26199/g.57230 Transcript_26199/m.57230 type:complete len:142 (+) Transcript_26199:64-489(+)|eukprot:CAMPEP_0202901808 /NCGR_PEP_ID=MMETSP1392-20130828/14769_1 /ASSEMBLY_ACC=CAM_ASM_000868 /TAXON_ID=225041 /ORGANISM="Chlamydomonas chlamydogama, Strain SAG 11-48b" /LENGTH=141 /DNA_ID=CAMNT_0049588433 /DNA_START=64 /DNA_END=489 /DNA_ORIENTATION=+
MAEAAASLQTAGQAGTSSSGRQPKLVNVHGAQVPLDWLVVRHDPKRYPAKTIVSPQQSRQANRDLEWNRKRDQLFAAAAAGVHLAIFAYNLAFWGFEGQPPDRYNPANTRLKLGIQPGRYGNIDGTKRVWYDNLSRLEGLE